MRARENLRVVQNPRELAQVACEIVLASARESIAARGAFHLALSGGTTPRNTYMALAQSAYETDFSRWHVWFGDERCVPPDQPDSNYRLAHETWLKAGFPPDHVHRMRGEAADPAAEARRYERELCEALAVPPRLDLVLLGLGADGHTASLFAGTAALKERRWVTVSRGPSPPIVRLSLTLATLNRARGVMFLVSGPEKAPALAAALGLRGPTTAPARGVHPDPGRMLWLVESSALPAELAPKA